MLEPKYPGAKMCRDQTVKQPHVVNKADIAKAEQKKQDEEGENAFV